jgi:hypothetical protein
MNTVKTVFLDLKVKTQGIKKGKYGKFIAIHAMKAYKEIRGKAPFTLNLGISWN